MIVFLDVIEFVNDTSFTYVPSSGSRVPLGTGIVPILNGKS